MQPSRHGKLRLGEQPFELAINPSRVERLACRAREHEIGIHPFRSCRQALLGLPRSLSLQRPKRRVRKAEGATALLSFRLSSNNTHLSYTLDGLTHLQGAPLEVYVAPTEAEHLAFAKAKQKRCRVESLKLVAFRRIEQGARLVCTEGL